MQAGSHGQLGDFLRARRERLRPEDFGLPMGRRRRTPGLRREEVAQLCGISPTWIAWIEQGRTASVSDATLAALARGLRLSHAERRFLFALASRRDPRPPDTDAGPASELQPLLDGVPSPAYVLDRHWNPRAWNRHAAKLLRPWLVPAGRRPAASLLEFVFLDPSARLLIVGWPTRARRLVAEYRADTAAWHEDPVRQGLVNRLGAESSEFSSAWAEQEVKGREGGQRAFDTPAGRRTFRQYTLRPAQWQDLKVVVLVPTGANLDPGA
jgi:transcriptional regulator with XRE-family HTH domain